MLGLSLMPSLDGVSASIPWGRKYLFSEGGREILDRVHHVYILICSVLSDSLRPHGLQPIRLFCPQDSPGKKTGVGCLSLLQGTFLTQGSNPCLLRLLALAGGFLPLNHLGSLGECILDYNIHSVIQTTYLFIILLGTQ